MKHELEGTFNDSLLDYLSNHIDTECPMGVIKLATPRKSIFYEVEKRKKQIRDGFTIYHICQGGFVMAKESEVGSMININFPNMDKPYKFTENEMKVLTLCQVKNEVSLKRILTATELSIIFALRNHGHYYEPLNTPNLIKAIFRSDPSLYESDAMNIRNLIYAINKRLSQSGIRVNHIPHQGYVLES